MSALETPFVPASPIDTDRRGDIRRSATSSVTRPLSSSPGRAPGSRCHVRRHAPPDADATFAGPPLLRRDHDGRPPTTRRRWRRRGMASRSPDTDATVMQPLHDDATIAGPPRPPTERPRTSRPGTQRPSTSRPGTHRPATNRPATGPTNGGGCPSDHLEPGEEFGTRYQHHQAARCRWHGRRLPGLGRGARRGRRHQDDSSRCRHRCLHGSRRGAPVQARAAAGAAGDAPQRGAHLRPRRDRRHQVHHDVLRRGPGPGDAAGQGRQAARGSRRCPSCGRWCRAWAPRISPASSIAI